MQIINQNKDKKFADPGSVRRTWKLLVSNWYVLVIAIVVAIGAAVYYTSIQVESSLAQLQISLKYNDVSAKGYYDYSSEMAGVTSGNLVGNAVDDLHLDLTYYVKEKNKFKEIYGNLPFKVGMGVASKDLEGKYIKVKLLGHDQYEISYACADRQAIQKCAFDSALATTDLKMLIGKNPSYNPLTAQNFNLEFYIVPSDRETVVRRYRAGIMKKVTKDLALLELKYRDIIPERAVDFLDTLARKFLANSVKTQVTRNSNIVRGLDRFLKMTDETASLYQDSLRRFGGGALSENIQDQKYISMITSLMLEKKRHDMKLMNMQDLEKFISENKGEESFPPSLLVEMDDPFLKSSLGDLYRLGTTKREDLYDATEKNRSINKLENNYEIRKGDLLKYIRSSISAVEEKINYFEKQIAETEEGAIQGAMTKEQRHLVDLQRNLKVNEAMYLSLLEKRNNVLMAQASVGPEYSILDNAHIIETGPPEGSNKIIQFLCIALALALCIIYLKNFFYEKIENIEYLKSKTEIPILGEMPYIQPLKEGGKRNIAANQNALGASRISAIRTNLEFALAGRESKIILVTSHNSGEGKTYNAVNLAIIFAKTKKKVLLIDMDFYKPKIASVLDMRNHGVGIESFYDGSSNLRDSIAKTEVEGMDAMLVHAPLNDASSLISGDRTKEIIEFARQNYDYVIIDTPPVGIISDALTLMKYSDINVYILNAVAPYRGSISQVEEIIEKNNFNIQLILNKVDIRQLQYYSKNYENYRYAYAS